MSFGSKTKKIKPNPHELALAQIAREKWEHFGQVYRPIEDRLIAEVEKLGTDGFIKKDQANMIGAMFHGDRGAPITVNPAMGGISGAYRRTRDRTLGLSAGIADAATSARNMKQEQQVRGRLGLVNLGRGIQGMAARGLTDAAVNQAALNRAEQQAGAMRRAANMDALGLATGAGLAWGKNWWDENRKPAASGAT